MGKKQITLFPSIRFAPSAHGIPQMPTDPISLRAGKGSVLPPLNQTRDAFFAFRFLVRFAN